MLRPSSSRRSDYFLALVCRGQATAFYGWFNLARNVNLLRSKAVPHRAHTMSSQLYPTVFAEHNHSARTYFPASVNFSPGVLVCPFQMFGTSEMERLEYS